MAKKKVKKSKKVMPFSRRKELHIKCEGSAYLDLDQMQPIQGQLKTLSPENMEKLKNQILQTGFSFPFFIYQEGPDYFILDGTQRYSVLKALRDDGWVIPKLPVAWIKAGSKKEAAKKLLAVASEYGRVNKEGLSQFMYEFDIDFGTLNDQFFFSEINLDEFKGLYFQDDVLVNSHLRSASGNPEDEWKNMPEFNQGDKMAYRHIIVHFVDEKAAAKFFKLIGQKDTGETKTVWFPPQERMDTESKRYSKQLEA